MWQDILLSLVRFLLVQAAEQEALRLLTRKHKREMNITQVPIPAYTGTSGNYMAGRQGTAVDTVVIHWVDGTLAVADKVFRDPSKVVSSHFAVEDGNVHQYVRVADTAFHAGNWAVNKRSVGIEHSAQPGRDASDLTYETSSRLLAQVAKALGKKVSDLRVIRHSDVVPTQCPGTVDIGRIRSRALEIESPASAVTVSATVSVPVTGFWIRLSVTANVRQSPSTTSGIYATYPAGTEIECDGTVSGQSVSGDPTWYHTRLHGKFVSASVASPISKPANQA